MYETSTTVARVVCKKRWTAKKYRRPKYMSVARIKGWCSLPTRALIWKWLHVSPSRQLEGWADTWTIDWGLTALHWLRRVTTADRNIDRCDEDWIQFRVIPLCFYLLSAWRGEGRGVINTSCSHQLAKNNAILRNLYDWGWSKCSWTGAINLILSYFDKFLT